jgi:hypothetical protein
MSKQCANFESAAGNLFSWRIEVADRAALHVLGSSSAPRHFSDLCIWNGGLCQRTPSVKGISSQLLKCAP